jgi:hypothetical protein
VAIHEDLENALDEIDAAVFSGDSFHDEDNLKRLKFYMDRWLNEWPYMEIAAREREDN